MPGYAFHVTMTLENPTDNEQVVHIPRGWIVEPDNTALSFQSAAIAKDYTFVLNPKEVRSVLLEAECWNKHLAPPHGIKGKPTPFKGAIQTTTNVWSVSSSPAANTILRSPSTPADVFSSAASIRPELTRRFLHRVAESHYISAPLRQKIAAVDGLAAGALRRELLNVGGDPELRPLLTGTAFRKFLIQEGATDDDIQAFVDIITDLYAVSPRPVILPMYKVALEVRDLMEKRRFEVASDRREELTNILRSKFVSILDVVPQLDNIGGRASA